MDSKEISNVTYVSALYKCYDFSSQRLLKDVVMLLKQDLNLIIFVDEFYHNELSKLYIAPSIRIIKHDLSKLTIYNMIMENKNLLKLPIHRNEQKDTHEYMALMNAKIEIVKLAQEYTDSPYLAWIDAGSSKMIYKPDISYEKLKKLNIKSGLDIIIPGCYLYDLKFDNLLNGVWWHYLGTFFACERHIIDTFYQYSMNSIVKFLTKSVAIWEVNVWIDICHQYPNLFKWYVADHNDSFTVIPSEYLECKEIFLVSKILI